MLLEREGLGDNVTWVGNLLKQFHTPSCSNVKLRSSYCHSFLFFPISSDLRNTTKTNTIHLETGEERKLLDWI